MRFAPSACRDERSSVDGSGNCSSNLKRLRHVKAAGLQRRRRRRKRKRKRKGKGKKAKGGESETGGTIDNSNRSNKTCAYEYYVLYSRPAASAAPATAVLLYTYRLQHTYNTPN